MKTWFQSLLKFNKFASKRNLYRYAAGAGGVAAVAVHGAVGGAADDMGYRPRVGARAFTAELPQRRRARLVAGRVVALTPGCQTGHWQLHRPPGCLKLNRGVLIE